MKTFTRYVILALLLVAVVMAQPVSNPLAQPQPDKEVYGIRDLTLFSSYDSRAGFKQAFGVDPPDFTTGFRVKKWFDTTVDLSDPEADACYLIVKTGKDGTPTTSQSCMPAFEAARANIPDGFAISNPVPGSAMDQYAQARARPEREIPIRALLPNEVLRASPFGVEVIRVDKRLNAEQQAGKFMPEDRAVLQEVLRLLK